MGTKKTAKSKHKTVFTKAHARRTAKEHMKRHAQVFQEMKRER